MTYEDYLLHLFYLIDSELKALNLPPLRSRGKQPRLHDSEVITMELAGEFLGIDTDKGIWQYFRRHHDGEFPALLLTDRSRFVRQGADLWRVKQLLQEKIATLLPTLDPACGTPLWLIDSFPLRVCRFKRAPRHKLFRGAAYGHDEPRRGPCRSRRRRRGHRQIRSTSHSSPGSRRSPNVNQPTRGTAGTHAMAGGIRGCPPNGCLRMWAFPTLRSGPRSWINRCGLANRIGRTSTPVSRSSSAASRRRIERTRPDSQN